MIKVLSPKNRFLYEKNYIYNVIFTVFLGLDYVLEYIDGINKVSISCDDEKELRITEVFFSISEDLYLTQESLPHRPLACMNIIKSDCEWGELEQMPIIYGHDIKPGKYVEEDGNVIKIGVDIFGSAFFMLTRYEELVKKHSDIHGRFQAKDSLAYQEGFLERPIINEYLELLWWAMKRLWPRLKRKERTFRLFPTHDVDSLLEKANLSFYQRVHQIAGDLIKRRDFSLFKDDVRLLRQIGVGDYHAEWEVTYEYIMKLSEVLGIKSTFFFMTPAGFSDMDGNYSISDEMAVELATLIIERGHRIGLHPSYASFCDNKIMKDNASRFLKMLKDNRLGISSFGGRQHCLRWKAGETWNHYESAGLTFDTTLSYADHIGFRCGICYEYPVFDVLSRRELNLFEWPLIVMDCTLWRYMELPWNTIAGRVLNLKNICKKYRGNFVFLWHNSAFFSTKKRDLYKIILEG